MHKTPQLRSTFRSCDVEKVHAVVARSTFPSQNVQSTPCSDHFWKLRCRKSVRRCGAKHMSKSKFTKHARSGPLLEVEMSKRGAPLWHKAHFQVKMFKTPHVRTTFGRWDVVSCGRRRGLCTLVKEPAKRDGLVFVPVSTTTIHTLHYATLHYTTLLVHSITLHYTTLHDITPRYTPLHSIPLHYTTLNYTTLN